MKLLIAAVAICGLALAGCSSEPAAEQPASTKVQLSATDECRALVKLNQYMEAEQPEPDIRFSAWREQIERTGDQMPQELKRVTQALYASILAYDNRPTPTSTQQEFDQMSLPLDRERRLIEVFAKCQEITGLKDLGDLVSESPQATN